LEPSWTSIAEACTTKIVVGVCSATLLVRFDAAAQESVRWRYDVRATVGERLRLRLGGCPTEDEAKKVAVDTAHFILTASEDACSASDFEE
jgi:hypothetical protein